MKKLIALPYDEEIGQLFNADGSPLVAAHDLNHCGEVYGKMDALCKLKQAGFSVADIIELKNKDLI
jgi:hypothetical protein